MIDITDSPDGAILPVWARPGAKANGLVDIHNGALRVSVTAAPEGGKANEAIVRVLAEALSLRRSQFTLISGPTFRLKRFRVDGLDAAELRSRVQAALGPTLFGPPDAPV